jgi:hypothetical protein
VVVGSYRKAIDEYFEKIFPLESSAVKVSDMEVENQSSTDMTGVWNQQKYKNASENFTLLKNRLTEDLKSVFNRGFYSGYFMGRPVGEWAKTGNSQATKKKETVGIITNYYNKIGVAEILVQGAPFAVGDELVIQGPTTGNMFLNVQSIQINHKNVERAEKGQKVALKVPGRVRLSDSIFRRYTVPKQ